MGIERCDNTVKWHTCSLQVRKNVCAFTSLTIWGTNDMPPWGTDDNVVLQKKKWHCLLKEKWHCLFVGQMIFGIEDMKHCLFEDIRHCLLGGQRALSFWGTNDIATAFLGDKWNCLFEGQMTVFLRENESAMFCRNKWCCLFEGQMKFFRDRWHCPFEEQWHCLNILQN